MRFISAEDVLGSSERNRTKKPLQQGSDSNSLLTHILLWYYSAVLPVDVRRGSRLGYGENYEYQEC